jgi:quinol-cytochrome oxidoreductase complex cytochrome b subunit
MRTVSWMWFWYFIIGFISGGFWVSLRHQLKKKSVRFVWYEWILCIVIFMLYILLVQTFIASLAEGEPQAAWMSVVFLGVPVVLLTVATVRSVQTRLKKG